MSGWERAAHVSAAISSAVALIALTLALRQSNAAEESRALNEWQRVIVVEILRGAAKGIEFKELLEQYTSESKRFQAIEIPKQRISESALRLVLLNLLADQLIVFQPPDRYQLLSRPSVGPQGMEKSAMMSKAIDLIFIREGPCVEKDGLKIKLQENLMRDHGVILEPGEAEAFIASVLRTPHFNEQGSTVCVRPR